ncbi:hypothetical protein BDV11DRAFT_20660 [Aspergillus similis]
MFHCSLPYPGVPFSMLSALASMTTLLKIHYACASLIPICDFATVRNGHAGPQAERKDQQLILTVGGVTCVSLPFFLSFFLFSPPPSSLSGSADSVILLLLLGWVG